MSKKNEENSEIESTKQEIEQNKPPLFPQIKCAAVASICQFMAGSINGWSGSTLTKLDDDFTMYSTQYSLVASATVYGAIIGSLFCGKSLDFFGRKKQMLMIGPLTSCGWASIGLAPNIYFVYLGRFICGFATGLIYQCTSIYISETCEARLRGRLILISSILLSLGMLLTFTLSRFFSWRISALLHIIPNVVLFISVFFVPESPYWYLLKGNEDAALKTLTKLRGTKYNVEKDLKNMLYKITELKSNSGYKELLEKRSLLPLGISLYVQSLQQICGFNVIIMYCTKIISSVSSMDAHMATIYMGIFQFFGNLVSPFFVDKQGRRILLIASGGLVGLLTSVFAGYIMYVDEQQRTPWVILSLLLATGFSYSLGLRPMTWLYRSEIFNTTARSVGSSVSFLFNRTFSLLLIQVYPYAEAAFGNAAIFLTFGVLSLLGVIGTVLWVPETKGKTLEEIQEYFEKRTSK